MERVSEILEKSIGDIERYLLAKSFSKDGKDGKDDINPPWLESDIKALITH